MFWDNLLKMGPTGCPETPVSNYHYLVRNDPEECSSHLGFDVPYCKYDLTTLKLIKLHSVQNNILSHIYPMYPNIVREFFPTSNMCTHTHTKFNIFCEHGKCLFTYNLLNKHNSTAATMIIHIILYF